MRYKLTEPTYILGKFTSGATVTLALYDLSDESAVALTSGSCNEVGALGVFAWSTANITTQPTVKKEYLWVMTDGAETQYGKIVLGGYPDQLDDTVSSRLAASGYTAPDNAGIAALPTLPEIEASAVLAKESTVSSRLAADGYTAPDNAGIAALPTLSEIEASAVLAKSSEIPNAPTLLEIEASAVLAKEATLQTICAVLEIVRKVSGNRIRLNAETSQIEVYEDDGVTVAFAFNGIDADGNPSIDGVFDRVPA